MKFEIEDVISELDTQIRWIEDIDAHKFPGWCGATMAMRYAMMLLKEQEAKPLQCKECSYHRNDGWCNEHGREVKESDYCSFGAWESR
jgi:hypothetical protein